MKKRLSVFFWEMQFDGKSPDEYTSGSVLRMCTSLGLLLRGEQIHGFTVKTGFDLDVGVVNGLLAMYAQCKHISEAEYLFGTMLNERNNVIWLLAILETDLLTRRLSVLGM